MYWAPVAMGYALSNTLLREPCNGKRLPVATTPSLLILHRDFDARIWCFSYSTLLCVYTSCFSLERLGSAMWLYRWSIRMHFIFVLFLVKISVPDSGNWNTVYIIPAWNKYVQPNGNKNNKGKWLWLRKISVMNIILYSIFSLQVLTVQEFNRCNMYVHFPSLR